MIGPHHRVRAAWRSRWSVALLVAVAAVAPAASRPVARPQQPVPHGPGSLSGIWTNIVYNPESVYDPRLGVLREDGGKMPPLQPWAAELLEKRIKAAEAGHPFANTKSLCLPSGVPQVMFGPRTPMQILETPGQVTLLIEEFNQIRIIPVGARHADDPDPTYMGDSVGHWEGDTFVVDTIGLLTDTTLDVPGTPHSADMHVVERFRRIARDRLEVKITITDPKAFTRPWTATTAFAPIAIPRLTEYLCENQRNGPSADGRTTMQMPAAPTP